MVLQYLKYRYNQSYSLKGWNISSFIKILPVCMLVCKNILDAITLQTITEILQEQLKGVIVVLEKNIYNTPTCGC